MQNYKRFALFFLYQCSSNCVISHYVLLTTAVVDANRTRLIYKYNLETSSKQERHDTCEKF